MKLSMAPSTIPEGTVSIGGLKNVSQVGIPDIGVASRARWLRYLLLNHKTLKNSFWGENSNFLKKL